MSIAFLYLSAVNRSSPWNDAFHLLIKVFNQPSCEPSSWICKGETSNIWVIASDSIQNYTSQHPTNLEMPIMHPKATCIRLMVSVLYLPYADHCSTFITEGANVIPTSCPYSLPQLKWSPRQSLVLRPCQEPQPNQRIQLQITSIFSARDKTNCKFVNRW